MTLLNQHSFTFVAFVNCCIFLAAMNAMTAQAGESERTLLIDVTGLQAGKGQIMVGVCSQEKFLKPDCEVTHVEPVTNNWKQRITLKVPSSGLYAIQVAYDLDRSYELETNRFGAPIEPIGFSNNPKTKFGVPRFKQVALELSNITNSITIRLE